MKPKLVKELPLAEREAMSCLFCNRKEDDEFLFGQFYTIGKQQLSLTVHYYCLLFASGLEQKGKDSQGIFGFLKKDILSAAERGKMIECHKCHTLGATVVCSDSTPEGSRLLSGDKPGHLHHLPGRSADSRTEL